MSSLLILVNLFLALVCGVECLFIVKILVDVRFKSDKEKRYLNITGLIGSWRLILVAVSIIVLREGYYVVVLGGLVDVPYSYELMNTIFLVMLAVGLYKYYKELKWSILIPPVE